MNPFMCGYGDFVVKHLLAKVALKNTVEDMRHLLVLPQLSWSQELQIANVAFESRSSSTMKLASVKTKTQCRVHVSHRYTFEAYEGLKQIAQYRSYQVA